MKKSTVEKVQELISKGKLSQAIEFLLKTHQGNSEFLLFSSRLSILDERNTSGTESNYDTKFNTISKDLLTFIEEKLKQHPEEEEEPFFEPKPEAQEVEGDKTKHDVNLHPHTLTTSNFYDKLLNIKNYLTGFVVASDSWKLYDIQDTGTALQSCRDVLQALEEIMTYQSDDNFPIDDVQAASSRAKEVENELIKARLNQGLTQANMFKIGFLVPNLREITSCLDEKLQLAGSLRNQKARDN